MTNEMNVAETAVVARVDQIMSEYDAEIAERAVILDAHVAAAKQNHDRVVSECEALMDDVRVATNTLLSKSGVTGVTVE